MYTTLGNSSKIVSSDNTLKGVRIVEVNRKRICPGEGTVGRKEIPEAKVTCNCYLKLQVFMYIHTHTHTYIYTPILHTHMCITGETVK